MDSPVIPAEKTGFCAISSTTVEEVSSLMNEVLLRQLTFLAYQQQPLRPWREVQC
jgi:hypothetical protein